MSRERLEEIGKDRKKKTNGQTRERQRVIEGSWLMRNNVNY